MESVNKELLKIENLVVEYTSEDNIIHAVNGIDLDILEGETVGLVGETGAGKTTIAKSILRILPDPPAKICGGKIVFQGTDILQMKEEEIRSIRGRQISMIFQDPMTALNPTITVGKQIAEAVGLHEKLTKSERKQKAIQILEKAGISRERYDDFPHQFSGGMKQRAVIAMALVCSPLLLLADEPTTALDVTIQAQVLQMMSELKKEFHTSVLMITHDLGVVAETCDKVAVIYAGEIIEFGTAEDIFDHAAHPYTLGLFGSLPDLNSENRRLKPISGMMPDPAHLPAGCKFYDRCPHASSKCRDSVPDKRKLGQSHYVRCFYSGGNV